MCVSCSFVARLMLVLVQVQVLVLVKGVSLDPWARDPSG